MYLTKRFGAIWLGVLWLSAATSLGGEIHWTRVPAGADAQFVNVLEDVECGALGAFLLSDGALTPSWEQSAPETGGSATFIGSTQSMQLGPIEYYSHPAPLAAPDWFLDHEFWFNVSPDHAMPGPWVAVLDFSKTATPDDETPHGHAVSWTIRLLSDDRAWIGFFPLDEDLTHLGVAGASDVHVLFQLCDVLEYIQEYPDNKPLSVNMSFGRLANDDLGPCDPNQSPALSCQIRAALDILSGEGVALAASSGNHGEVMFPADYDKVISAGRLDLHRYDGSNHPGVWQNSPETSAFFPGDGMQLEDVDKPPLFLPSGSSFSAAAFTAGLVSALESDQLIGDLNDGLFFLRQRPLSNRFQLVHWSPNATWTAPLPNAFGSLFSRLRSGSSSHVTPNEIHRPDPSNDFPGLSPSFPVHLANTHPGPETNPCLPCTGHLLGTQLQIDLSASGPLQDDWELREIFVRFGDSSDYRIWHFDPGGGDFQNEDYITINLNGLKPEIILNKQISLNFKYHDPDNPDESFWTSSNVTIPGQIIEEGPEPSSGGSN